MSIEGAGVDWLIDDYRKNNEVMPLADIVRVVQGIGAALDYAHSKDVIHRDVKPGNIIVDQQGRAMLADFGLALLSDLGTQGKFLGRRIIFRQSKQSHPHTLSPRAICMLWVSPCSRC